MKQITVGMISLLFSFVVLSGLVITAGAEETIGYQVQHYLENASGGYDLKDSVNETGAVDAVVTAQNRPYAGYTFAPDVSGTIRTANIAADGSTVLRLYYTANSNTPYVVVYYIENEYGVYSWSREVQKNGKTGETVTAESLNLPGYTETADSPKTGTIRGDGYTELSVYYYRNTNTPYIVLYYLENEFGEYELTETVDKTGTTDTKVTAATKEYAGYVEDIGAPDALKTAVLAGNGSTVLKVFYARSSIALFKVEHYLEEASGGYSLKETVESSTRVGVTKTASPNIYLGYAFAPGEAETVQTASIAADGSTVFKLYYTANTNTYYQVFYVHKTTDIVEKTGKTGALAEAEYRTYEGYTLIHSPQQIIAGDGSTVVIRQYKPNTNTHYKVECYLENESGGYDLKETLDKMGSTDSLVTLEAKYYPGYTEAPEAPGTIKSAIIAADGNTVFKMYYDILRDIPMVVSVTPSGMGTALSGNVVITFSKPMNTQKDGLVSFDGGILEGKGTWSNGDKTYTIPYSNLQNDIHYTIWIIEFSDTRGVMMAWDTSHSFTTMASDVVSPAILGLTVSPQIASVQKRQSQAFTVVVTTQGGAAQTVNWSVNSTRSSISADGILTVASDETAKTLTVTATSALDSSITDTATVTVLAPIVGSYQPSKIPKKAVKGTAINVQTVPGAISQTITSNKGNVVSVDGNKLTFVGAGKATVKVTYKLANAKKAKTISKSITVTSKVTGIELNMDSATIARKHKVTLRATLSPSDATLKTVKWTSSNKKIAKVSGKGVVTGVSGGQCTITARTKDGGLIASATITVTPIYETGIKMSKISANARMGKYVKLKATPMPSSTDFKTVTWHSSDDSVATVDSKGKVTAVSPGVCTITATSQNGKTASCTFTTLSKK